MFEEELIVLLLQFALNFTSVCLVLPEYLEVVRHSLASECPLLVEQASDSLVKRLKDPETYGNITKDFKYSAFHFSLQPLPNVNWAT